MKISIFPAFLSLILTAVLSYLIHTIAVDNENYILLTIGTAISILFTLPLGMAVKFNNFKVGVNIRIFSIIMFLIMFFANLCFAWFGTKTPYLIILLTFLLVVHILVVWKMSEIQNI